MLLYYITDRRQFAGSETQKCETMLRKVAEAARSGVDLVQIREKDLPPRQLFELVRAAAQRIRDATGTGGLLRTRVLVNSRTDVALAAGVHGVHLTGDDIRPSEIRAIVGCWYSNKTAQQQVSAAANQQLSFTVAVSCHNADEVRMAEAHGADLAVFAPVFEKQVRETDEYGSSRVVISRQRKSSEGLAELREACHAEACAAGPEAIGTTCMPVVALGGITVQNARDCLEAGAAGVAAIRLFQDNDVAEVTRQLRALETSNSRSFVRPILL